MSPQYSIPRGKDTIFSINQEKKQIYFVIWFLFHTFTES